MEAVLYDLLLSFAFILNANATLNIASQKNVFLQNVQKQNRRTMQNQHVHIYINKRVYNVLFI